MQIQDNFEHESNFVTHVLEKYICEFTIDKHLFTLALSTLVCGSWILWGMWLTTALYWLIWWNINARREVGSRNHVVERVKPVCALLIPIVMLSFVLLSPPCKSQFIIYC